MPHNSGEQIMSPFKVNHGNSKKKLILTATQRVKYISIKESVKKTLKSHSRNDRKVIDVNVSLQINFNSPLQYEPSRSPMMISYSLSLACC